MLKTMLLTLVLLCPAASAAPVVSATGLASPDATITFSEQPLVQGQQVTNQFAPQGLTLSAGLYAQFEPGQPPPLNNPPLGFTFPYLFNAPTAVPADATPAVYSQDFFFTQAVSDATLNLKFRGAQIDPGIRTATFTALLAGAAVDTFQVQNPDLNNNTTSFYGFTGITFDTISLVVDYSQTSLGNAGLAVDNVSFNLAAAAVPELDANHGAAALAFAFFSLLLIGGGRMRLREIVHHH